MRCSSYKFVKLIQPNIKIFLQQHCDYVRGNSLYPPQGGAHYEGCQQMIVIFNNQGLLFALLDCYNQTLRFSCNNIVIIYEGFIMIHYI